jgi:hypothetical protein
LEEIEEIEHSTILKGIFDLTLNVRLDGDQKFS